MILWYYARNEQSISQKKNPRDETVESRNAFLLQVAAGGKRPQTERWKESGIAAIKLYVHVKFHIITNRMEQSRPLLC